MRKTDNYRAAVPYGEKLSWMLRIDPEVWDGEGGVGGGSKGGTVCIHTADSLCLQQKLIQHCTAIIFQ